MNLLKEAESYVKIQELEKLISKIKDVTGQDVKMRSRRREIVYAKKIYCHVARMRGYEFKTIGEHIGVDHSTVVWHCNDTMSLLEQDNQFKSNYLRVQGKPMEGKCSRDYFDLSIAQHMRKDHDIWK